MWGQLRSRSFCSHCHRPLCLLNTPCLSYDNRLRGVSTTCFLPPLSLQKMPEGFSQDAAFIMLLPWVKTANGVFESIIPSLRSSSWLLKPLVKSSNVRYPTYFSNALHSAPSFLSIYLNQNHLSSPGCSPAFSAKFYRLPKPDYRSVFRLGIPTGFVASKTEFCVSLGL